MARKVISSSSDEPKAPGAGYDYEKNRSRTIQDIARDAVVPPAKEEDPALDSKPEATPPAERSVKDSPPQPGQQSQEELKKSPLDEAKEFVEKQKKELAEQTKKDAEDIARKTLTEELKKIKDSELTAQEKKEAAVEAKAKWSGFDPKTGEATPKNYDEIVTEARRLAAEDFDKRYEDRRKKEFEDYQKQQDEAKKTSDAQTLQREQLQEVINNKITEEIEELYAGKHLDRTNEEMRQDLFRQAAVFNAERVKNNQAPIDSITRFYFNYYKKPEDKIAGADAPVAGNSLVTPKTQTHSDYIKIHNSSFRSLAKK